MTITFAYAKARLDDVVDPRSKKRDQAPLGQRIRAVGLFFYKKGDLTTGNRYQLRRNSDNPKRTNCFEVRSRHITIATMNKNFSRLLAPFVDENIICELTW